MIKKIFSFIALFLLSLILVSCIVDTSDRENKKYVSNNAFETKIIETSKTIRSSNVSLVDENVTNSRSIGGAVVVYSENGLVNKKYYALTTASNLTDVSNLSVFINHSSVRASIIDYSINDIYDIGIFSFETRLNIPSAKLFADDKIYDFNVGDAVLAVGSNNNLDVINSVKDGFITNVLNNDIFTHDADINMGEIGSGVYNLSGFLVGINSDKIYKDENISSEYNVLGLNYGYKASRFANVIKNISQIDFKNNLISNTLFNQNLPKISDNKDQLETLQNSVYESALDSVVTIKDGSGNIYSGIIVNKIDNKYQIATIFFLNHFGLKVNDKYNVVRVSSSFLNIASILEIETTDTLTPYRSDKNPFISLEMNKLVKGQRILAIGSVNSDLKNQLNTGNLSKDEYQESYIFMHDAKTNLGQLGAPIFNLNGNLIGININKVNSIETQTGVIAAEGLTSALNISYLIEKDVMLNSYESINEYETSLINVVKTVDDAVVTVKTNTGHGSGVIYRKEIGKNNIYTYYVMTNSHVVEDSSEISISFSDARKSIRAKDYYNNGLYDLGIVRFESSDNYNIVTSTTLDGETNEAFVVGQTTIAIGTPESSDRTGYVTKGIVGNYEQIYGAISKLAIRHNSTLNPGNSGGPLFNLKGELIAINVAKETNYMSKFGVVIAERVSISLNINILSSIINSKTNIIKYKKLDEHTPRLGITVVKLSDFLDSGFNNSLIGDATYGIVVIYVDDLYDAYGKVKMYDVIISINGSKITSNDDVVPFVSNKPAGTKLMIEIIRKGEINPITIEVLVS